MKKALFPSVALLAVALAGPAYAYGFSDFFGAVPNTIQDAHSGINIGIGQLSQHYQETYNGASLDSESGTIDGHEIGVGGQWSHFGFQTDYSLFSGNTHYNGAVQNIQTGTITPVQSQTGNKIIDFDLKFDYGFSPLPGLAVMPDVFWGRHAWYRTLGGVGGYQEDYYNGYDGVGLDVDYNLGRGFVLSGNVQSGNTFGAYDNIYIGSGTQVDLGSHSWTQEGVKLSWIPSNNWNVFVSYSQTKFGYGASSLSTVQTSAGTLSLLEPNSTTRQDVLMLGVRVF
ncbi:hypothetical protein [Acidihalobacter prosperus]|uniref:Outer membrane protein beta-barrel domain-containing protein n=1 Tax=Acidihalobacter prosperus TaxID=160660 RepID=A0A1A6C024_9GAMM|nr:hypothetical protein [Acidihalobacter prosperus]OBS07909.1 hypothetical protein Thpro_022159 [Acidihalobacter prosperus]